MKGKKACPICEDDMESTYLSHCGKHVYMNHRRFLNRFHPYRKKKAAFNGRVEEHRAPRPLTGNEVYDRVKRVETVFGKAIKNKEVEGLWKKESIFWKLEY